MIYRETPAKAGRGFERYTMPKPCWAVVLLGIEPLPRGSGLVYDPGSVPNEQLFYRYQHHIATAVPQALAQGMYNWQVTDLKVTLLGGEHHLEHTQSARFLPSNAIGGDGRAAQHRHHAAGADAAATRFGCGGMPW